MIQVPRIPIGAKILRIYEKLSSFVSTTISFQLEGRHQLRSKQMFKIVSKSKSVPSRCRPGLCGLNLNPKIQRAAGSFSSKADSAAFAEVLEPSLEVQHLIKSNFFVGHIPVKCLNSYLIVLFWFLSQKESLAIFSYWVQMPLDPKLLPIKKGLCDEIFQYLQYLSPAVYQIIGVTLWLWVTHESRQHLSQAFD